MKMKILFTFTTLLLAVVAVCAFSDNTVHAAARDDGYQIDDSVFYKTASLSESQIDSFINSFPKSCLKPQNYPNGLSWATFREPLNYFDYSTNDVSPARIIWKASQLYKINPQVLIATLEKEQSLISGLSSAGCPVRAYNSAMGYNCPDGSENALKTYPDLNIAGTCVAREANAGFSRQLNRAAWQLSFDGKRANGNLAWMGDGDTPYYGRMTQGWRQQVNGGASIYYDGYTSIDGKPVFLKNGSSAALYNYTPHFSGFNSIFTKWFGSAYAVEYVPLNTPRWMVLASPSTKYNALSEEPEQPLYPAGTQLRFVDKALINGVWHLRTAFDSSADIQRGIPITHIANILATPLETPRYMELNSNRQKWDPTSGIGNTAITYPQGMQLKFTTVLSLNDVNYYRTEYDSTHNNNLFFTASGAKEIDYQPFLTPRYMQTTEDLALVNPVTGEVGSSISAGTQTLFSSKISVNGKWYYRSSANTSANSPMAVAASKIQNIPYIQLTEGSRWMQANKDTYKFNPSTQDKLSSDVLIKNGQAIEVTETITVSGTKYYRTAFDVANNHDKGLLESDFDEMAPDYSAMSEPRYLTVIKNTSKINPLTGEPMSGEFPKGTRIYFSSKIVVSGVIYLRSQFDTTNGNNLAMPLESLMNS